MVEWIDNYDNTALEPDLFFWGVRGGGGMNYMLRLAMGFPQQWKRETWRFFLDLVVRSNCRSALACGITLQEYDVTMWGLQDSLISWFIELHFMPHISNQLDWVINQLIAGELLFVPSQNDKSNGPVWKANLFGIWFVVDMESWNAILKCEHLWTI